MKRQSLWKALRIAAAAFFLLGCGAAFAGIGGGIAEMLHVQFGPALMRCLAAFSAGALATALGIAAFTFLFGRFYCFCCSIPIPISGGSPVRSPPEA